MKAGETPKYNKTVSASKNETRKGPKVTLTLRSTAQHKQYTLEMHYLKGSHRAHTNKATMEAHQGTAGTWF